MKKLFTFAACLTVTALLHAQTPIFVTPDGTDDGTSWANACNLETAVVWSLSGAETTEIWVQKGTYNLSKMLVIPDSVKVYGGFSGTETNLSQRNFSANSTIIDGQQKIGSVFRLGNSAEINGFTIQNGNANGDPHKNGGGVWADDNAIIQNCIIQNNAAIADGGGVYAKGNLTLINSTVKNNTASNGADLYGNCITQVSLPVVITHPDGTEKSIIKGGSFPALSVSATSALPLSYQWFSNTTTSNENGTNLGSSNGAQTATYTPQGSTAGISYYYCEITNSDGTAKSNVSGLHTVTTPAPIVIADCNPSTFDFGMVSFQTNKEYPISGNGIEQIWSDAVTATGCQKTTYDGGHTSRIFSENTYNVDCRTNPDHPGDFFSWCAVACYADVLCPAPWHVPTKGDFIDLDKALGGTGAGRISAFSEFPKYFGTGTNQWGGAYGGICEDDGTLYDYQGSGVCYWSQTERSSALSHCLYLLLSAGYIYPQADNDKHAGLALRCVR